MRCRRGVGGRFFDVGRYVTALGSHCGGGCSYSRLLGICRHRGGRKGLSAFVISLVRRLGTRKRMHAKRACRYTLGDFVGFHGKRRVLLSRVGRRVVRGCRACLQRGGLDVGAVSFCVHVLETACGQTISGSLAARRRPFQRICAKMRGAAGHTISVRVVGQVGRGRLSGGVSMYCTHSVFLFDFCAHKVSFVSVTCLGGGSLYGNVLACQQGGAKRRLRVG